MEQLSQPSSALFFLTKDPYHPSKVSLTMANKTQETSNEENNICQKNSCLDTVKEDVINWLFFHFTYEASMNQCSPSFLRLAKSQNLFLTSFPSKKGYLRWNPWILNDPYCK